MQDAHKCIECRRWRFRAANKRSDFGQRLLAMRDTPAACATLGLDLTRLKLAVFSLSAAMAGVGGALYAGTLGSVSPERFSLFESLPLLLLTVVGGISTAAGAVFTGIVRSEEHTSELQSLMRISYAVFCLKKKHIY